MLYQQPQNPNSSVIARIFSSTTPTGRAIIAVVGSILLIAVLCCGCGTLASLLNRPSATTSAVVSQPTRQDTRQQQPTPAPTATATPKPTPKPAATPNPNLSAPTYAQVVSQDTFTLSVDLSAVSDSCSSSDLSQCNLDLQTFDGDVQAAQADLRANPAPPCYQTADSFWRKALAAYHQGAQDAMNGINDLDPSEIDNGAAQMKKADTYVTQATNAISNAHC